MQKVRTSPGSSFRGEPDKLGRGPVEALLAALFFPILSYPPLKEGPGEVLKQRGAGVFDADAMLALGFCGRGGDQHAHLVADAQGGGLL